MKLPAYLFIFLFAFSCSTTPGSNESAVPDGPGLDFINAPEGFKVTIFADNVPNARAMTHGADGIIYVGSRREGKVHALTYDTKSYTSTGVHEIASGLQMPSGVAYKNGALYIGAVSTIWRMDNIDNRLQNPPTPVKVTDTYPTETHHGWKYLGFGPDGKLYVPVGAPCNICNNEDTNPIFASLTRMNPDGSDREIIAHGIRNTVGFAWHPETDELWFTDNGRDMLGDDIPPCELNHLETTGQHFGYPFLHGNDIWDEEFGDLGKDRAASFTKPAQELGPHVAPLGMIFYTGNMFPAEYKNRILIAEHGSWNRSKKIGYRITQVTLNGNESTSYSTFIEGWLQSDETVIGRPVDLLQLADGSVLVSDDQAGKIYRITYSKP